MKKKSKDLGQQEIRFESKELKKEKVNRDDLKKVITFVVILVIMFLLFGGLFYFNGKYVAGDYFNKKETTTTTATIDVNLITVSSIFKMDGEYYVLAYDTKDDADSSLYGSLYNSYNDKDTKLYKIDLANASNKEYYNVDGEENTKPSSSDDILFTRPTLMIIKNGKVKSYITKTEDIINKLS